MSVSRAYGTVTDRDDKKSMRILRITILLGFWFIYAAMASAQVGISPPMIQNRVQILDTEIRRVRALQVHVPGPYEKQGREPIGGSPVGLPSRR